MIAELNIRVVPEIAYTPAKVKAQAAKETGVDPLRVKQVDIVKRSIDARQRQVMVNLSLRVHIDNIEAVEDTELGLPSYPNVGNSQQVVVVGAGPAGLFAALTLIENGVKPIVLERGKDVDSRRKDLAAISREQKISEESNYCFGEGGAGAYSDGKLYTRSKKRGSVDKILKTFVQHGAQKDILIDAHPHIGTDRLPEVIKGIRKTIINHGGEVRFQTKVCDLIIENDSVKGVVTQGAEKIFGPVILATGHSARDVYQMLQKNGIEMTAKGIAVGVRLEHPQKLIDQIQYHSREGRGMYLPAAEYSMLTRVDGRAVYSFCMCPGGFIIPAASRNGQLVVNGMSPSNRGTRWANSGMVVEILPEDLPDYDQFGALKMMHFQEDIERNFSQTSEGTQKAPAQRMTDFVKGQKSATLPRSSYAPGVYSAEIDKLLPPFVSGRLQKGFEEFGRKSRGFLSEEAILVGDETRTSAPVQISRDPESLHHIAIKGLYPCGEGAGYAGGIVSAAIDGIRCAEAAVNLLARP